MTQQCDRASQVAVNLPELLVRVNNDRDLMCELIGIFKGEFPRLLLLLQESVTREDTTHVETTSHALKGMLSCLSATRAAVLAGHLEQLGREGKTSALTGTLTLFEHEVANLLPELDDYTTETEL